MKEIRIRDDFIKLGQAMKLAGLVGEGSEAGKKLFNGDVFSVDGEDFRVIV